MDRVLIRLVCLLFIYAVCSALTYIPISVQIHNEKVLGYYIQQYIFCLMFTSDCPESESILVLYPLSHFIVQIHRPNTTNTNCVKVVTKIYSTTCDLNNMISTMYCRNYLLLVLANLLTSFLTHPNCVMAVWCCHNLAHALSKFRVWFMTVIIVTGIKHC